jgi:hypothetical protein
MSPSVFPLTVTMVESSFRTSLMTAVGATALPAPGFRTAGVTAVSLAAVAVPADPEQCVTCPAKATPLTKHHLAVKIHVRREAALDHGDQSWQVRTSSSCGYLLKVARLDARAAPNGPGILCALPPSTKNFTPSAPAAQMIDG